MNKIFVFVAIFILGFGAAHALSQLSMTEKPLSLNVISNPSAPQGMLNSNNIQILNDRIIIYIANSSLSRYAATGSMLPVLNEDSKGIKIPVTSPEQLHVGDIITYRDISSGDLIIHRIMSIGFDEVGTYYILKGDNNFAGDGKVRFEQIVYKLVVLVY